MTLLAIDPGRSYKGDKSIGYAIFTLAGLDSTRGSLSFEKLLLELTEDITISGRLYLDDRRIDEVVIEDYINNAQSKGGQRNGTSECIGAVEALCFATNTPFTRQRPDALGPAKLHAPEGSYKKLKHLRHEDSAFLHGYEFLVRRGDIEVDLSATMGS